MKNWNEMDFDSNDALLTYLELWLSGNTDEHLKLKGRLHDKQSDTKLRYTIEIWQP